MSVRAMLVLATAAFAAPAQQSATTELPAERTLADFAEPAEGRRWRTVLDGVMGGRSTGSFVVEDDRMRFTGVLNTNGGGFSSVRRRGTDLRLGQKGERGIHLQVRGDGRTYTLRLRQPNGRRRLAPSYRTTFATDGGKAWQDVFVPYASLRPTWRGRKLDLPPVDPSRVDELGISIDDKIDGPFALEVRKVGTYGPFDFDAFRRDRRPLVLFAATAGDPDLVTQLAAMKAARADLTDRDMEVVVVLDRGPSRAGSRPLDARTCKQLRRRFADQRTSGFAALLIGKDGGVKRTSATPLTADALFAQIDRMPMRRRELRDRIR